MSLYRFKTFTTQYFFPEINSGEEYLYGLYSPFGGKLSRVYWYLFRKLRLVRGMTAVSISQLPFPYQDIVNLVGDEAKMSFNMGSPGIEQKISLLGLYTKRQETFFAKFSQQQAARRLTINEIEVYRKLQNTHLVPKLYNHIITENYVFIQTEYVSGVRPPCTKLDTKIIKLCLDLSHYQLSNSKTTDTGLATCLSHGDFCPWNMLEQNENIRLIDWEMASDRPLGYDLFTFITQVAMLFHPEKALTEVISENISHINFYFSNFSIKDWSPYLHDFACKRKAYEDSKGNSLRSQKYDCIINYHS